MKRRKRKNTKNTIKYLIAIVAICLCWLTFKHSNTTEQVVGIISLAYLCGLAIFETVSGFLREEEE